jgi:3-deoxy-D-manno-octulosonic acid (KDO) 8-phosphate synthase
LAAKHGFSIGGVEVGGTAPLLLIAGPCVLEDPDEMLRVASHLAELSRKLGLGYIFKSSYLKDNRTRGSSPRGPGAQEGLKLLVSEKITSAGGERILLTERGTTFGYHDLVVDFRGFAFAHELGWPWIYDVTHSLQRPSGEGTVSGGTPGLAPMMARAAVAAGVDGLFLEAHPEPSRALSDALTQLPLHTLEQWLPLVVDVHRRVQEAQ